MLNRGEFVYMFEKHPNPIRKFSKSRDAWFLHLIHSLGTPMNLFNDIRESQLSQLIFQIEAARIKKNDKDSPPMSLYDQRSLDSFVPRFILMKQFREFFKSSEIELADLQPILTHEKVVNFLTKGQREDLVWIDVIPTEGLDAEYALIGEIIYDVLLKLIADKLKLSSENRFELVDALKEKNSELFEYITNLSDLNVLAALNSSETLEKDENGARIIPVLNQEIAEGEKSPTKVLQDNELRARSNILYSFLNEFLTYLENPEEYSFIDDSSSEDVANSMLSSTKPIEGSEYMNQLFSLEMALFQPYPDKERVPVVQDHFNTLAKKFPEYPAAFWDLSTRIYHVFAAGMVKNTLPFEGIERKFKFLSKDFWHAAKTLDADILDQLVATLWMQLLVTKSTIPQYAKEADAFVDAITRLEHIFWVQDRIFFGREPEYSTPFVFWTAFAALDNYEIKGPVDAENVLQRFTTFLEKIDLEAGRDSLDLNTIDMYTINRRVAYIGVQTGNIIHKAKTEEFINNAERYLTELEANPELVPASYSLSQEKQIFDVLKQSLQTLREVEVSSERQINRKHSRRRRR